MTNTNLSTQTFATMAELIPEMRAANTDSRRALPNLSRVLRACSPLPGEAVFLGMADDGLPVLLNLKDPVPGPVLIAGDAGSGKTRLLQIIAKSLDENRGADEIRYAVLTDRPKEWEGFEQMSNCEGILPFGQALTAHYLSSLVEWAHTKDHDREFLLLLVDSLGALAVDDAAQQAFRWLLLRGPSRRIWPFVTLRAAQAAEMTQWLSSFRTRLCGYVADERVHAIVTGPTDFSFNGLLAGSQFAVREGRNWLPFWLPTLD